METTIEARPWNNVARLAIAQALAGANASVIFATGAIVGARLAPDPAYATLPITCYVVGLAAGALPVGWIARRFGRRTAFYAGAGAGVLTGLLAALAVDIDSFWLFCIAALFSGFYGAVVLSFRFAAADGASPEFRPRALAWVMAGGVFAGVLGPQLVTWTMDLSARQFAFSYLAQAGVAVVAGVVLSGVNLPRPSRTAAAGRKLREIVLQERFIVAAVCGVVSYPLMNLVMTSAPLAMHMCGLQLADSNFALQWHIVAMYGPSFFTGALIARFGAPRVVATGLLLTAAAAAVGLSANSPWRFTLTLVLLGLGWNFGFVGASAMVLETHRPEERTRVQSVNDFLVFGTMAIASFSSGQLLTSFGWRAVCDVVFPPVAIALSVLAASRVRRAVRAAAAS